MDGKQDINERDKINPERFGETVIRALKQRGVNLPCPRCGQASFTAMTLMTSLNLQNMVNGLQLGGESIPCVAVMCNHCGYIALHNLMILGVLTTEGNITYLPSEEGGK